jgi:hypothetical protein
MSPDACRNATTSDFIIYQLTAKHIDRLADGGPMLRNYVLDYCCSFPSRVPSAYLVVIKGDGCSRSASTKATNQPTSLCHVDCGVLRI